MAGQRSGRRAAAAVRAALAVIALALIALAASVGPSRTASAQDPLRLPVLPPPPSSEAAGPAYAAPSGPEIRARLVARRTALLSAEISGRIVELPLRAGERFPEGARLAALDCAPYEARARRAEALRARAAAQARAAERLDRTGAVGRLEVEVAQADAAAAEAELRVARIAVSRCAIDAPFAGRVAELRVERHRYVGEGEPLLEILDDGVPEVELVAPSRWLSWIAPGFRFAVLVEETGRTHPAEITRLAARVDPVSQSVVLYARIVGEVPELVPGMSGVALIEPPAASR